LIVDQITGSSTLPGGILTNLNFQCGPNQHAISGGYAGPGPASLAVPDSQTLLILGSRRTGPATWTVTGINRSVTPAVLTGYGVCEQNKKGLTVTEAATQVTGVENGRSAAEATCTGRTHSVSGGFNIVPNGNIIPRLSVDENAPVGEQGWRVSGWDFPTANTAPAALQTSVYCKPDAVKKKKKKKKK
jgi:hypothetical protein